MKEKTYKPVMYPKIRLFFGIAAFIGCIAQIVVLIVMFSYNDYYDREIAYEKVGYESLDNLQDNKRIIVFVPQKALLAYSYTPRNDMAASCAAIRTLQGKVILVYYNWGIAYDGDLKASDAVDNDYIDGFVIQGEAGIADRIINNDITRMIQNDIIRKTDLTFEDVSEKCIMACDYPDNRHSAGEFVFIIFTIVLLPLIGIFLIYPIFRNIRYRSVVKKGTYRPLPKETKADVTRKYQRLYDSYSGVDAMTGEYHGEGEESIEQYGEEGSREISPDEKQKIKSKRE